jgi:hypothetical protein
MVPDSGRVQASDRGAAKRPSDFAAELIRLFLEMLLAYVKPFALHGGLRCIFAARANSISEGMIVPFVIFDRAAMSEKPVPARLD